MDSLFAHKRHVHSNQVYKIIFCLYLCLRRRERNQFTLSVVVLKIKDYGFFIEFEYVRIITFKVFMLINAYVIFFI